MNALRATGDHALRALVCAGLYGENSPDIVAQAGNILGLPLETIFNLQLPEGNPDELASPFPGWPSLSVCPTASNSEL